MIANEEPVRAIGRAAFIKGMSWNKPNGEAATSPLQKRKGFRLFVKGAAAVAIVALGAGIAAWWLWPTQEHGEETTPAVEPTRIREVKPTAAARASAAEKPVAAHGKDAPEQLAVDTHDAKPKEKLISSTTNELGYILERVIQPNGRPLLRVREVPSAWEYPTDELIAMSIFDNDDTPMPPLPPTDGIREDKMFLESIKKPIRINPDDAPEVKARKKIVESVREDIAARMEKGENFMDILEDNRALVNENIDIRGKALRELSEIEQTGSREDAEVYRDAMNQQFDNLGIKHIELTNEGEQ